jgi:hypothetical protein
VDSLLALVMGGASTSDKGNPIDLLLNSQRRRANAQADFYRAVAEYNKSIANVHFRKGSLLEYNNIQLAEGPWPQKAYWDALGRARERDASLYLDYGVTRPRVASQGPVAQFWHPADESPAPVVPDSSTSPELLPDAWPEADERLLDEFDGPALDAASINPTSPAPLAPVPLREDVESVQLPRPQAAVPAAASPAPDRHAVTQMSRARGRD